MDNLCFKIEYLRQKMYVTTLKKGISHPDVLMASQRLDQVINMFYKLNEIKSRVNKNNNSSF